MNCKFCGTENPDNAKFCLQCGKPFSAETEQTEPENTEYPEPSEPETTQETSEKKPAKCNVLSIVGLIMSLASLTFSFVPFQIIISSASLVICIIAMVQIKIRKEQGSDLALAGLIVALVSIIINLFVCLAFYLRIMHLNALIEWFSGTKTFSFLDGLFSGSISLDSLNGLNL